MKGDLLTWLAVQFDVYDESTNGVLYLKLLKVVNKIINIFYYILLLYVYSISLFNQDSIIVVLVIILTYRMILLSMYILIITFGMGKNLNSFAKNTSIKKVLQFSNQLVFNENMPQKKSNKKTV